MFTSNKQIPIPTLVDFLSTNDFAEFAQVNRIIYTNTKTDLAKRKKSEAANIITYFLTYDNRITIYRQYDKNYEQNVQKIFMFLPELFDFIQLNKIKYLDLSSVRSHRCNSCILISRNKNLYLDIINQLINLLKGNNTLEYCNIGFFEWIINRNHLQLSMQNHPTITCVSIRSITSKTNFNEAPNSLYKLPTGEFVWSHFRPN
jgi:hypothetical protein